jgi:hypothetical protein
MPSVRSTISDEARDDGGRLALPKPVERQTRHMRVSHPRRVELRAETNDEQHWKSFNSLYGPAKRLEARRIDPMHILEDYQHWIQACQSRKLRR